VSAKKFSHHFTPHHHPDIDEQHRAHALNQGALLGYVAIFIFTIAAFYFIRVSAPQILGTAQYTAEQIVELTNVKRVEQGLAPLVSNSRLAQAAGAKASDMYENNYWAHFSPQSKSPWSFIKSAGYKYIYAGENLARDFNDPESVVNAWMVSPTHRSNVLDKNFKEIGVSISDGVLTGREGVLVVQMFGSGVSQVPSQSQGSGQTGAPIAQVPGEAETQGESIEIEPIAATAFAQLGDQETLVSSAPATVLASNQYSISKIISLLLVGFVFILFVVEVAVTTKKSHLNLRGSTLAHLGLLAMVLFALWYAVQGSII